MTIPLPNEILEKVKKILALGERAGTEDEANAAMSKAHEILARYNLSVDDIPGDPHIVDEDYVNDGDEAGAQGNPWQRVIWMGIAEMYFCKYYSSRPNFQGIAYHHLIGKPSNIAIVKYIARYVARTCLSEVEVNVHKHMDKISYRTSFKNGFANRVYHRCQDEIAKARAGQMKDSSGRALILHPLYDKTKNDIQLFMKETNLRLSSGGGSYQKRRHGAGHSDGSAAGDRVGISSNGVGHARKVTGLLS